MVIFLIFFCCNRFIRASVRVLKRLMKKGKKNKIKAKEKAAKAELKKKPDTTTPPFLDIANSSTTDDDK